MRVRPGGRASAILALLALAALAAGLSCRSSPSPTLTPSPEQAPLQAAPATPTSAPTAALAPTPGYAADSSTTPPAATPATKTPLTTSIPVSLPTAAPTPSLGPTTVADARDRIALVIPGEPPNLNVMDRSTLEGHLSSDSLGDRLLLLNFATRQLEPQLEEGWEFLAPDRWRFSLRPGVSFHNGEPFDAEAASWAIDWQGDPRNVSNATRYFQRTSTSVVDRHTIEVRSADLCPALPSQITHAYFQAPDWARSNPVDFASRSNSNGPYQLSRWVEGEFVLLSAYRRYWRGEVSPIREATILWDRDPAGRAAMVATDQAQWAFQTGLENRFRAPKFVLSEDTRTFAVKLDARFDPLTSDRRVRRALAVAVDCDALAAAVTGGFGTCRGVPFHQASLGPGQEFPPFPFDTEEARDLFAQAGVAGQSLTLYVKRGSAVEDALWEGIASYWRNAGLRAEVRTVDARTYLDLLGGAAPGTTAPSQKPVQAIGFTHANDLVDPSASLIFLACEAFHASFYCNPEVERRLVEANGSAEEERVRKMAEMTATLREELPIIWWMSPHTSYSLAGNLDWTPRPDGLVRIDTMRYAR